MSNLNENHTAKRLSLRLHRPRFRRGAAERASVRTVLLPLICFVIGTGVGAFWLHRSANTLSPTEAVSPQASSELSTSTKSVLSRLDSMVEIRYYALLDSGDESLKPFIGRVDNLLSEFKRAANGRLSVTRLDVWSEPNTKSASADGVVPFNLEKGAPSYLGLSLNCEGRKETLSQITPEWESSLEFDLARALARLVAPPSSPRSPAESAQAAAVEEALRRTIPNPAAVSFDAGKKLLQEAAIREVESAVNEMQQELTEIRQRILKAESVNADSDRQAAVKELQTAQAKHLEKLRAIASRSNAQIEALARLKGQ